MSRFAKQPFCPSSATISAYNAGTLSFLVRRSVADHLAVCEFCGVEATLWLTSPANDAAAREMPEAYAVTAETGVTQVPLALRLLAESTLSELQAAGAPAAGRHAA
ncbi:MAG TPA: hypothetical protein VF634_02095 [Pyrinomonadaceae bacterium]|jgi:anti-sigma factor ChrR (cupin superfamily)